MAEDEKGRKKDIKSVISQALKTGTTNTFAKEDKKLSRRTVAKEDKKNIQLATYLSQNEYDEYLKYADSKMISTSNLLRILILEAIKKDK